MLAPSLSLLRLPPPRPPSRLLATLLPGPGPSLTLYTRPGCSLCDVLVSELSQLRASPSRAPFSLSSVDISLPGNEALLGRYRYDIPVVHRNGGYLFKHRLPFGGDEGRVRELIETGGGGPVGDEPDAGRMERRREERDRKRGGECGDCEV
ncbi:hypothetical protein TeGR_g138 [Tetraparma gracilis]|uniref:Glutaredoxin-like protein n=1 Tax=Tetraparma gracilis TaxID=2962635 RepID=A0ABQ6MEA1_9STRA|nr:hypothetical protein TeGR_g138 [Tetraparma gracilis]